MKKEENNKRKEDEKVKKMIKMELRNYDQITEKRGSSQSRPQRKKEKRFQ
jgi:hypothetical protein